MVLARTSAAAATGCPEAACLGPEYAGIDGTPAAGIELALVVAANVTGFGELDETMGSV